MTPGSELRVQGRDVHGVLGLRVEQHHVEERENGGDDPGLDRDCPDNRLLVLISTKS